MPRLALSDSGELLELRHEFGEALATKDPASRRQRGNDSVNQSTGMTELRAPTGYPVLVDPLPDGLMTPMKFDEQASDGDLAQLVMAGDEQAFLTVYRRWQSSIYRFALHMTGNASLAEEITQEVFVTFMREAKSFDPLRGALRSFLYGICRNHALRCIAHESSYVGLPEPSSPNGHKPPELVAPFDLFADFSGSEIVKRVRRAVLVLPPRYRAAVVLCDLHEMSYEQAAAVLGCPVGTLRSRLHRARELLLVKLGSFTSEPVKGASFQLDESKRKSLLRVGK